VIDKNDVLKASRTVTFVRMKNLIDSLNGLLREKEPNLIVLTERVSKIQVLAGILDNESEGDGGDEAD